MADNDEQISGAPAEQPAENKDRGIVTVACPCCGKPMDKIDVNFNNEITDMFLACMMTGEPFSHTYSMYGGKLRITARRVPLDVADRLTALDGLSQRLKKAGIGMDDLALNNMVMTARMYACVPSIAVRSSVTSREYSPAAVVEAALPDVLRWATDTTGGRESEVKASLDAFIAKLSDPGLVSATPMDLLVGTVAAHNRLYSVLVNLSADENFWEGIELA